MKYKAGDKVLLHTYEYLDAKYPREEGSGYIDTGIDTVVDDMIPLLGKVATIREVTKNIYHLPCYHLKEDSEDYNWYDEMIAEKVGEGEEPEVAEVMTGRELKRLLSQLDDDDLDLPITIWHRGDRLYLDNMLDTSMEKVIELNSI